MGDKLDFEMKVRITPAMSEEIDALVSTRPTGAKRSDVVREALTLYLADQLHQSGKDDLRKAAQAIKGRIPKR